MKIKTKNFRALKENKIRLKDWSTNVRHFYKSKKNYKESLIQDIEELSSQQQLLYASNNSSLLIIFQAMDAAGKDGAIKHVMSGINPQGC